MDAVVALFSVILLASAAWMMFSHVRTWRAFQQQARDAEDFDYRRRQHRRRMQISAMLGLLAVALMVGEPLTLWLEWPLFFAIYWLVVILVTCWVLLLALVDMWATKHHFGRLRDHCLIEQAKLRAEAGRARALRGNGQGDAPRRPADRPEGKTGSGETT